jgi:two-component system repressor protein LuxO
MTRCTIYLIEDSEELGLLYGRELEDAGYDVLHAGTGAGLMKALEKATPDLLFLDVRLPDTDGISLLRRLKEMGFDMPVVVMTGHGSIPVAVEAMQAGAADFLVKPFPLEKLAVAARKALSGLGLTSKGRIISVEKAQIAQEDAYQPARSRQSSGNFIGNSIQMQRIYDIIESAAASNATIFVTGESGTGKELCAEAVHRYSPRSKGPFIAINCAAIPRDLLESELFGHVRGAFTGALSDREGAVSLAAGGTLFLDEIAEMALDMQSKLLRFLQDFTYRKIGGTKTEKASVRLVCATNKDPLEEIAKGRLRQDLYYRLHVVPIHMPPLRDRRSDILDLAEYFLALFAKEEKKSFRRFSAEAERLLLSSPWLGNVRELQNVLRRAIVLEKDGEVVEAFMLKGLSLPVFKENRKFTDETPREKIEPLWKTERSAIENAIAFCEGNIPRAAALLGISPSTIYRKKSLWDEAAEQKLCY